MEMFLDITVLIAKLISNSEIQEEFLRLSIKLLSFLEDNESQMGDLLT
jgi:hypothetical protein